MKDIIEGGLAGLANAGLVNGGNWFVGHFGAEALSLAFLLENNRVSNDTADAVKNRIHAIFDAHPKFFNESPRIETMDRVVALSDLVTQIEKTIAAKPIVTVTAIRPEAACTSLAPAAFNPSNTTTKADENPTKAAKTPIEAACVE